MEDDFHTGQKKRHRLFADETDRLADNTQYVVQDLNALGLQVDTAEVFYLKSLNPTLWVSTRPQVTGALSSVQFSISWSGGDGDFKLTAAALNETFSLVSLMAGIKGILVAVELNLTESFVDIGTAVGLTLGPAPIRPDEWLGFSGGGGPTNGQFGLHTAPNTFGSSPRNGRNAFPENYLGLASDAPTVQLDTGAQLNVNLATAGKVFITLHYIPIPTPTG